MEDNNAMLEEMSVDIRMRMSQNHLTAKDLDWVMIELKEQILKDIPIKPECHTNGCNG